MAPQLANVVLVPIGIALNYLPSTSGRNAGIVSRAHEPLLAAAGWAFAIWGVLFASQIAYAIYQALPAQRCDPTLRRIGWLTALNSIGAGFWTVAFCQEAFMLSWLLMLGLLANLIAIDVRLRHDARSGAMRWLVRVPFAMNLGWMAVATLLDTSLVLWDVVGWRGAPLTVVTWAQLVVVAATVLGVVMVVVRRNHSFALVVAWGLVAIATYRLHLARSLGITAYAMAGVLVLSTLLDHLRPRHEQLA